MQVRVVLIRALATIGVMRRWTGILVQSVTRAFVHRCTQAKAAAKVRSTCILVYNMQLLIIAHFARFFSRSMKTVW